MISVIIPAHNAEETIADCLQSLQLQMAGPPTEIIVVDDASADQTATRARALGARVIHLPHGGPAAARNAGIEAAHGEILLFTDADCCPAPDWLARLLDSLRDLSVAGVKGAYATRQREWVARMVQVEFEERYDRLQAASRVDFFDTYSLALRRSDLQALGPFDTALAISEDTDMAWRFAAGGRRLMFNREAVVYHRHPADWPTYMRKKFWRSYWRMHVYNRYPGKVLEDSYTPNNLKLQIILLGGSFMAALTALLGVVSGWVAVIVAAACMLTGWPLYRVAWRYDRALAPLMPLFIFIRALALGLGVAFGLLTMLRILPLMNERGRAHT